LLRAIENLLIALPFIAAMALAGSTAQEGSPFILSCVAFTAGVTFDGLVARYGPTNVMTDKIYLGEGEYEEGTVLYPDTPKRRAEILWKEQDIKRSPRMVRITGAETQWRTPQGLTLGLALGAVEKLNRRPFRLLGFGWDYGGTTISWSGGALGSGESTECRLWARFEAQPSKPAEMQLSRQVTGDQEFSSGHPGMQASNARVYQIGLHFPDPK